MLWVLIYTVHLTVCSYHVTYVFQSESTPYCCLNVKELLAQNQCNVWSLSDCNHSVCKETLNHLAELAKWMSCCECLSVRCVWLYAFMLQNVLQTKATLYSCLNVKTLFAQKRRNFRSLSDCNGIRTNNHIVYKRTLDHLVTLVKWLSCVVSTYQYGAFDCMFLPCHVRVSEWIHILQLLEYLRNSLIETGAMYQV